MTGRRILQVNPSSPENRKRDDPPQSSYSVHSRGSNLNAMAAMEELAELAQETNIRRTYRSTSDISRGSVATRSVATAVNAKPRAAPRDAPSAWSNNAKNTRTPYSNIIQKYINEDRRTGDGQQNNPYYQPIRGSSKRRHSEGENPIFGTSSIAEAQAHQQLHYDYENRVGGDGSTYDDDDDVTTISDWTTSLGSRYSDLISRGESSLVEFWNRAKQPKMILFRLFLILLASYSYKYIYTPGNHHIHTSWAEFENGSRQGFKELFSSFYDFHASSVGDGGGVAPSFVFEHPYVTSSYYTATKTLEVLYQMKEIQVEPKKDRAPDRERGITSRLAILRPFCEFDADALPTTFACWNSLVPCRAAEMDLSEDEEEQDDEWVLFDMSVNGTGRKLRKSEEENWECEASEISEEGSDSWLRGITGSIFKRCKKKPKKYFDDVPADALKTASVDLFLFYSQTFSENEVAMHSVDEIMKEFFSPGGWSRCFDNIYAIEANIPKELDLYIPAAQEELYSWVNGPNRQYEAGFRIIQSGEWGDYDGFYLMEGDSVPVKNYWLDVIMGEIKAHKPFAVLGAQYDGDKWDAFYEDIPLSLLHHTNGNGIYNTSHPLLERLTGQLEVEAPCPYNSIPYDYRMSQMWVEGTLGIVPELAPKIMLNEEGENITLSDNKAMFSKWANRWKDEVPYKFTKAIHNYAATNLIPRHLGPEYVIHGAKLYSPWDPARTQVTLVIMEWFFDRSLNLIEMLDSKDHPFSQIIIMIPPSVSNTHDYTEYTSVPVTLQFRDTADYMDLCSANVKTEWFMITNSYHQVSRHVDLMFTPGKFVPVVPFTPATYPFCLKYPYCKEIIMLSQRWNPKHKQVILDMDMLYHTKERNDFCGEWRERNGDAGEGLYAVHQPLRWKLREEKIIGPKGPTGTDYLAYLNREGKASMYKMTDRSLYGARAPFVKVYKKEEKLDGMSEEELARRVGMTLLSNTTECSCDRYETEEECLGSGLGCQWRPLFESCHPPEMIDDGVPICSSTEPPTMSPTINVDGILLETESPTVASGASTDVSSDASSAESGEANKDSLSSLASMFKTREHEFDDADVVVGDASDGRRNLLVNGGETSFDEEGFAEGRDTIEDLEGYQGSEEDEDDINREEDDSSNVHRNLRVLESQTNTDGTKGINDNEDSQESMEAEAAFEADGYIKLKGDLALREDGASDVPIETEGIGDDAGAIKFSRSELASNSFQTHAPEDVDTYRKEDTSDTYRHLISSTESPTLEMDDATSETIAEENFVISPGLKMIVANHETRDFILKELSNNPSLESRFGAKLFHTAVFQAEKEDKQRQSSLHRKRNHRPAIMK